MSDTPRTDAALRDAPAWAEAPHYLVDLARELERDLTEYKRLNAALATTLEVAQRDADIRTKLLVRPEETCIADAARYRRLKTFALPRYVIRTSIGDSPSRYQVQDITVDAGTWEAFDAMLDQEPAPTPQEER